MTSEEPSDTTSRSRFRFKSESKSKRSRPHTGDRDRFRSHSHRDHKHRHKRSKTAHSSPKDDPSAYDSTYEAAHPDPRNPSPTYDTTGLDPDAAFRESLFDALADDEGAAYWEGVYGQPIHVYPQEKVTEQGELERMSDEEYAEYVRVKMWEKTHQHLVEEREKREEERRRRKEERRRRGETDEYVHREEREREKFRRKVEQSLRRGEERKCSRKWQDAWSRYIESWDSLKGKEKEAAEGKELKDVIPWPVESGKRRHVAKEDVEDFMRHAPSEQGGLGEVLKKERIRWHPDKIMHRFGGGQVDEETLRAVTAVFQTVDSMWNDVREKGK